MGTLKIRGIGPIAIMSRIIYNIRDMKGGGIVDNGYTKRIRERVLSLEDGTVFVMSDFADIADTFTMYSLSVKCPYHADRRDWFCQ